MFNRYRPSTQVLFDRAFIKLESFPGKTYYIPMLLHGRKDFITNKHHEIWKCHWQKDKVWVFPGEKSDRLWFEENELEDFFLNSTYLDQYEIQNTRKKKMTRNDYVKWMMKGLNKALTLNQLYSMNNWMVIVTGREKSPQIVDTWYFKGEEVPFVRKLQEYLLNPVHEFVMVVPCDPRINYPEKNHDGSSSFYTIMIHDSHFRKFGANTIYTSPVIHRSKKFATEKDVESFLNRNAERLSSYGFEIKEHEVLSDGSMQERS